MTKTYAIRPLSYSNFTNREFESLMMDTHQSLATFKLAVPTVKEQQVIGAYFSNLDNLINSHQEKISQLEILKKKLLQDMFI